MAQYLPKVGKDAGVWVDEWMDAFFLSSFLSFFLSCSFPKRALARGVLTSKVRVGLRRLMPLCWPWPLAFKCQLLKGGFHHFVNDLIFKICNGNIILYIYPGLLHIL